MKPNKWIAVLGAAGILAIVGIVTFLFVKGRGKENLIDRAEARNPKQHGILCNGVSQ